jgi:hypothetical protein
MKTEKLDVLDIVIAGKSDHIEWCGQSSDRNSYEKDVYKAVQRE